MKIDELEKLEDLLTCYITELDSISQTTLAYNARLVVENIRNRINEIDRNY